MNMRIDQDLRSSEKDLRALKQRSSFLFFFIFLLMIIGLIKIIELTVIDRQEYFSESEKISSIEDWNENKNYVVCDTNIAIKLLPKVIGDFIPYGPILGQYLFIKRK